MAKTVPISDETKDQIDALKKYYKKESILPVEFNQKEVVEIAISRDFEKMERKHGKLDN